MNKIKKWLKVFVGALFIGFLTTSCTANFCSNKDVAYKWYATYGSVEKREELLNTLSETVDIPHKEFWDEFDAKTLEIAKNEYNARSKSDVELKDEEILQSYGYALFLDSDYTSTSERELWVNFDEIVKTYNAIEENKGNGPTSDFVTA